MNKIGRNKLIGSLILTLILIIFCVTYILSADNTTSGLYILLAVIIMLAIFTLLFSFHGVKRIEKRVSKLPEAYQTFYLDAYEAVMMANMAKGSKREVMELVLEILELSHLEGRSLNDVIGESKETFIQNFIKASGGDYSFLYFLGYTLSLFIGYLMMMKAYLLLKAGELSEAVLQENSLDLGIIITYALIAFVFFPWLLLSIQKAARMGYSGIRRITIAIPMIIPLGLMFLLIAVKNKSVRNFLDQPVSIFPNYLSLLIGVAVILLSLWLIRLSRKLQLKKSLSEHI